MANYQYIKIPLKHFTQEICEEYDILNIATGGYVYIEIQKGMYGLKEAGILTFNYIVTNLAPYGYHPVPHTEDLWKHETR